MKLTLQVPVIMIMGDKDWVTPYPIAEEYFNMLEAPYKQFYFIEGTGHSLMLEDPEAFCDTVLSALDAIKY